MQIFEWINKGPCMIWLTANDLIVCDNLNWFWFEIFLFKYHCTWYPILKVAAKIVSFTSKTTAVSGEHFNDNLKRAHSNLIKLKKVNQNAPYALLLIKSTASFLCKTWTTNHFSSSKYVIKNCPDNELSRKDA